MSVSLPADHGIAAANAGDHKVAMGATLKVAGVRFSCDRTMDCVVTVTVDDEGTVTATYSDGEPTVDVLDATGNQAFENLSAALRDADQSADLRANRYHDVADVPDDLSTADMDESVDNGGGVTSSLTAVSDIFVSVDVEVVRAMDDHATAVVQVVDPTPGDDETERARDDLAEDAVVDQIRDPQEIMNPVLVDEDGMFISTRTSNFMADADWDRMDLNPAAEQNMDEDKDDIWTNYFRMMPQNLAGGRTLHLDLRSDHDANVMEMGTRLPIARGPGHDDGHEVMVDWNHIMMDDVGDVTADGERNLGTDVETGIPGSYMGVRGVFYCAKGSTSNSEICRINHHQSGMMGVSEADSVMFVPYVYAEDTDWLVAGVWLTIPDDTEDGDYAISAFVFGNNPYKADSAASAGGLDGTATYAGEAFGRYAEVDGAHTETGRFQADAKLTATFNGTADGIGTIQGDLTGFMANGQSESWDVNFEQAMIQMGMDDQDPPQAVPDSALRFNVGASGHARGHGLTGYWNGQFYGGSADGTDDELPGSAAGTFGLTSERDATDDYSLVLGGAFAAHKEEAATE